MLISPQRQAINALSALGTNVQFAQRDGAPLVTYQGEATPEFQKSCEDFLELINEIIEEAETVKMYLPDFKR